MFETLAIGATGMQAQQAQVDTIANNLANMNTPAFKKARITFAELAAREAGVLAGVAGAGSGEAAAMPTPGTWRTGAGVGIAAGSRMFDAGELKKTDAPLDLAIQGEGLIEVLLPDGTAGYTRGGSLRINKEGLLATAAGHVLKPGIAVPEQAQAVLVARDGRVSIQLARHAQPVEAGQLELVRFPTPAALAPGGDGLYLATPAAGMAVPVRPGEDGAGTLAQGYLEASNVKLVDEMVSLMLAQRAYEASVKVVQAGDEMLGLVNNLRK